MRKVSIARAGCIPWHPLAMTRPGIVLRVVSAAATQPAANAGIDARQRRSHYCSNIFHFPCAISISCHITEFRTYCLECKAKEERKEQKVRRC